MMLIASNVNVMHFFKIPFTASTENVIHLSFMRDTPNPNLFTSDYNKMLALINVNLVAKKMTMYIVNLRPNI